MGWRKNARDIIRVYPVLKRKEAELRTASITQNINGEIMKGHGISRTTENVATRELPIDEQRALDAVMQAIITTGRYRNGELRLRIIDMVYWKQTYTLEGAAKKCYVSERTAYNWHNDFVALVDAYYRFPENPAYKF